MGRDISTKFLTGMLPGIGGIFDNSQDEAQDLLAQNVQDYQNLATPNLTFNPYSPEAVQYQTISEDPALKQQQMALLQGMAGNAEKGLSDSDAAAYRLATQQANQAARQQNQALINNAAARGVGGSGVEMGLREMANQGAMQNANQQNLNQAANSAQMRAAYQNAYGNQLGNVRSQDYNTAAQNAGIINAFNQLNTGNRNQAQLYNQQMPNQLAQQNYGNQLQKLGGVSNARLGQVQGYAAENAANAAQRNENLKAFSTIMGGVMGGM